MHHRPRGGTEINHRIQRDKEKYCGVPDSALSESYISWGKLTCCIEYGTRHGSDHSVVEVIAVVIAMVVVVIVVMMVLILLVVSECY